MKRILLTGANGMVGSSFQGDSFIRLSKNDLDVTDFNSVDKNLKKYMPDVVIHLAAMTNVDQCEKEPTLAYLVNVIGTYNIAKVTNDLGIHMIFVSTGGVFNGKARKPYDIKDLPKPISVYTRTKYIGEIVTRDININSTVARTGWIFGGFDKDKKFVSAIVKQLWNNAETITAVSDTFGCPTYAKDLADELINIANNNIRGLVHLVNDGYASRYDIAKEIIINLNSASLLKKASVNDFASYPAPRPKFEVIKQSFPMRDWREALKDYLFTWKKMK